MDMTLDNSTGRSPVVVGAMERRRVFVLRLSDFRTGRPSPLLDIVRVIAPWAGFAQPEILLRPGSWQPSGPRRFALTVTVTDPDEFGSTRWSLRAEEAGARSIIDVEILEDPRLPSTPVTLTVVTAHPFWGENRWPECHEASRLVHLILESARIDCLDGPIPVEASPTRLTLDGVEWFRAEVLGAPARRLPVVGIALGDCSETNPIVGRLGASLVGLAHPWVIPRESAAALNHLLDANETLPRGGVSVWWPLETLSGTRRPAPWPTTQIIRPMLALTDLIAAAQAPGDSAPPHRTTPALSRPRLTSASRETPSGFAVAPAARTAHEEFFAPRGGAQVWAIDTDGPSGRRLFHLARDYWTPEIVGDCYRGRFRCPVEGCPCPEFQTARGGKGTMVRAHFAHRYSPEIDHDGDPSWLRYGQEAIVAWLSRAPGIRAETDIRLLPNHRADVHAPWGDGVFAFLLICEELSPTEWLRRHREYRERGVVAEWLFRPGALHARRDLRPGVLRLTATQRAMVRKGVAVRWLNVADQALATARVDAPGVSAGAGGSWLVPDDFIEIEHLDRFALGPDGLVGRADVVDSAARRMRLERT